MKGTIWFTGLPESGKTTIALELVKRIKEPVILLDGNIVRKTLSSDLGYTKEDRDKNIKRIADVCSLISSQRVLNIACVISPTRKIRRYARKQIKEFIEVYVECDIKLCEKRDSKGHYKKFRKGIIKDFVGLSIPYEEPSKPEIIIDSSKLSVKECVDKILKRLN